MVCALAFGADPDILYLLDNNRVRRVFNLAPGPAPAAVPGGVVNAFSYAGGPIAPGELVSIFGSNFASALQVAAPENNRYPTVLATTRVLFSGYEGAITAISPSQINVFVPDWFSPATTVSLVVQVDTAASAPMDLAVRATAPGFSTTVLNQDGSINSTTNPAAPGSIVTVFGGGAGVMNPGLIWGNLSISTPFSAPVADVAVSIGGQPAQVLYAGSAPFQAVGVLQVNARVPASVTSAAQVQITVGGVAAVPVAVAIH